MSRTKDPKSGDSIAPQTTHFDYTVGSKPVLPPNMSTDEYLKLRQKWYELAASTGFEDIEKFDRTGRAQVNFTGKEYMSTTQRAERLRPDIAEYYRLCGAFLHEADFIKLFGDKYAAVYKKMFELHTDGGTYRGISKYFREHPVPRSLYRRTRKPKKAPTDPRRRFSEFWVHRHMKVILRAMWAHFNISVR